MLDERLGIEVGGYHLHFISAERGRGGHVLERRIRRGVARVDVATGLHVERPPAVVLDSPELDRATRSAIDKVERQG